MKSFSSRAYPELEGFRTKDSGLERLVTAKKSTTYHLRQVVSIPGSKIQDPRSKIQDPRSKAWNAHGSSIFEIMDRTPSRFSTKATAKIIADYNKQNKDDADREQS